MSRESQAVQARRAATRQFGPISLEQLHNEFGEVSSVSAPLQPDAAEHTVERKTPSRVPFTAKGVEIDLQNVLAGWNARDAHAAQDLHGITQLHALPLTGDALGATAVGKLLNQNIDAVASKIDQIRDPGLRQQIFQADINNPDSIRAIHRDLTRYYRDIAQGSNRYMAREVRAAIQQRFNSVLQYSTLRARVEFEAHYPTRINPEDSPAMIKQKTEEKNRAFQQHMTRARTNIEQGSISQAGIGARALGSTRPNYATMNRMMDYCNAAFSTASQYQGQLKRQKHNIQASVKTALHYLQTSSLERQLGRIRPRREMAETKLTALSETIPTGAQRDAFHWVVKDKILEAKWQSSPTPDNARLLRAHRDDKPADFSDHQEAIVPKLREAQPVIQDYSDHVAEIDLLQESEPSVEKANRDLEITDLNEQLAEALAQFAVKNGYEGEAVGNVARFYQLERLQRANPTHENQENLERFDRNHGPFRRHTRHMDPTIDQLIDDIVACEAENQRVEADPDVVISEPVYQLAQVKAQYEGGLLNLVRQLEKEQGDEHYELGNPCPKVLATIQAQADAIRLQYKQEVTRIHQEAGTDKVLENLSKPLDALRATSTGNWLTGRFRHNNQGAAYLDVLDSHKFQLPSHNGKLPRLLLRLESANGQVNALLQQREAIEHAIEVNPSLAAFHRKTIGENDRGLRKAMAELTELTGQAEQADYLATHPDISDWAQKAAALQDAVNRGSQRHRWTNTAANAALSRPIFKYLIRPVAHRVNGEVLNHTQNVGGINGGMQYNPNAATALETTFGTQYFEQLGLFKWRMKEHKTKIKQADGSDKVEEIIFSKAKLKEHFADFCEDRGLKIGNTEGDVKVSEKNGSITYRWPHQSGAKREDQYRDQFLKYLETKYKEQRGEEIGREQDEQHSAGVTVDSGGQNRDEAIHARSLGMGR